MYNFLHIRNRMEHLNQYTPDNKPTIVLIRGLSRSYRAWLGFAHDLSEDFDVICLDLAGIGLAKDEKPLYRVSQMARELVQVIQALKLPQIYLVAPSLGALVALEMIPLLPIQVVRGLVIMAPSHSGVGIHRVTSEGLSALQKAVNADDQTFVKLAHNLLLGHKEDGSSLEKVDPERLKQWQTELLRDHHELGRKGQLAQIMASITYTSRKPLHYLRHYQIPLKCVIPKADHLIPVEHSRQVYEWLKHPHSAVIELEHAGHDLIVTHAHQTRDIVTQFIKQQSTYRRIYNLPPLQSNGSSRRRTRKEQNQLYTSLGLFSLAILLFSWIFKKQPPK